MIREKKTFGPFGFPALFAVLMITALCSGWAKEGWAQSAASQPAWTASETNAETPVALAARQAVLLRAMISDPANADIAFEYAAVSTLLGDYEAAVSAYERLLIFSPGLARINLELGVLYFQLKSYETARYYFLEAIGAADATADIVSQANTYLAAVSRYQDPAGFRAIVVAGVRYQSNANAAPGNRRVALNGGTFILDDTSVGQSDVNGFVASQINGSYDLGTQGDTIDAELTVYAARFAEIVRLDTALVETTLGPTFNLERIDIDDTSLGIYAIAAGVRLDHANYSGSLGFGTRLVSELAPSVRLDSKLEWRRRWFNDTAEYPTVSEQNGSYWRLATTVSAAVSQDLTVRSLILADFEEAKRVWTQSWEIGGGIGATVQFASPIDHLSLDWSLDVEAGYIYRKYEGPDPNVNANETQADQEGWLRTGLTVPIKDDFAVGVTGEFRRQHSNYDLSTYSNASALVSLTKAF